MLSADFPVLYTEAGFYPKFFTNGNEKMKINNRTFSLQSIFPLQICIRLVNIRLTIGRTNMTGETI